MIKILITVIQLSSSIALIISSIVDKTYVGSVLGLLLMISFMETTFEENDQNNQPTFNL